MAEFPALPFYTDAYLADTRHLTTEEHGAYLLLLLCAWRTRGCKLADDDKTLARITGLSPTRWRRMRQALESFFTIEGGFWRQKKLTCIYEDVAARVERNRQNGAKGGRRRAVIGQSESEAKAKATKSKSQKKLAAAKAVKEDEASGWIADLASLCDGGTFLDPVVIAGWQAAGVELERDVLPTIRHIQAREFARVGSAPKSLGYYREAVLEALQKRSAATKGGRGGRSPMKPQSEKSAFDASDPEHWFDLLGDASSRFRGDYMAKNWFIPDDHPVYRAGEIGPNPRLSHAPDIPEKVRLKYAINWGWL